MPDELSEKMVRLLEEIRDLTKVRNEKVATYIESTRKRYDDALERQKKIQERALTQRRVFLWILAPLLLVAIGFMAYIGFWVIPNSEQRDMEHQVDAYQRMMESNQTVQPH